MRRRRTRALFSWRNGISIALRSFSPKHLVVKGCARLGAKAAQHPEVMLCPDERRKVPPVELKRLRIIRAPGGKLPSGHAISGRSLLGVGRFISLQCFHGANPGHNYSTLYPNMHNKIETFMLRVLESEQQLSKVEKKKVHPDDCLVQTLATRLRVGSSAYAAWGESDAASRSVREGA